MKWGWEAKSGRDTLHISCGECGNKIEITPAMGQPQYPSGPLREKMTDALLRAQPSTEDVYGAVDAILEVLRENAGALVPHLPPPFGTQTDMGLACFSEEGRIQNLFDAIRSGKA